MKELGIPGVAVGIVQDGKVVFAGGYGVRDLGQPAPVDGDTEFMIASNTKALTTLLLARLVDGRKLTWDTPVTKVLPTFKLGDAETTREVKIRQLICACTGLPRQDLEWLFQFQGVTPEDAMATLATMQPTSKFGELFQYSNPMAGAAGFTAGHVLYPNMELGAAYDKAMQTEVFDPLGMKSTTFDYAKALAGDHAMPHSPDVDGKTAHAVMEINYAIIPLRPAGAAWCERPRHAALHPDGARRGQAPGRQDVHSRRSRCSSGASSRSRSGRTTSTGWVSWSTRPTAFPSCITAAT